MCRMLSTYDDRSSAKKIWAALRAYALSPLEVFRAQIVHFHLAGEISLLRKLPIVVLSVGLRRRFIVHIHACSEESLFVKTPRWAWKFVLEKADLVLALSPSWARIIEGHSAKAKVEVLSNPVKTFFSAPLMNSLRPRVLYVGKLEARKGFDVLIAAAAITLQEFPNAEFWFAGHGDLQAAHKQAEQLGIQNQIRLLGWQSGEELEEIYNKADLFCLPSYNEGVPMSVLEAMSHGLPVVCTRVGGLPDIVREGENGLFVEAGNPHSIANALLRLLRDPSFAKSIARAGRETVLESFSLDMVARRLESIYHELSDTVESLTCTVLDET
jgi:glycosyltransferase involved in cell wall biosynthesis